MIFFGSFLNDKHMLLICIFVSGWIPTQEPCYAIMDVLSMWISILTHVSIVSLSLTWSLYISLAPPTIFSF